MHERHTDIRDAVIDHLFAAAPLLLHEGDLFVEGITHLVCRIVQQAEREAVSEALERFTRPSAS